ncbi:hypothetical protein [Streptomyces sp. CA-111067]|uniref:hypothetical protein n=1 Tax=Streptomyces sp. CA-111067 TaxID=3240046 RepID=UPI003D99263E
MTTADETSRPTAPAGLPRLPIHSVVTTWILAGMVVAGYAWTLGLEATWWQRIVLAVPVAVSAVLDSRGVYALVDARHTVARGLSDLGWLQLPLAVAGGAWLAGLTAGFVTRLLVGSLIIAVAALIRYAPTTPTRKGGAR